MGIENGPDIAQQLLQMQSLISSSNGGSKGSPLLNGLGLRDADVFTGLSAKGKGLNADSMINKVPQAKPGMIETLKQQMGLKGNQMFDDIKKVAQSSGVMYSGAVTNGEMPSSANISGGSVGQSSGGMEI